MAARSQKKNKRLGRTGKLVLGAFAALILALAALAGIGAINASVVRIRRADVVLRDLPDAFDGVRVLYASDIDLCGVNTPRRTGELFNRLRSLEPDILLLGGDYTSATLMEVLNRSGDLSALSPGFLQARSDFFHYIASFDAPLGKYAIASPDDPDWDVLGDQLNEAGVRPLINERCAVGKGEDVLWLAGICREGSGLNSAGSAFDGRDCVLTVAFGPSVLPVLLTSEAADGGQWSDLVLCGHTHGGQVRLFGRSVLSLGDQEQRFRSGWYMENGLPILVTTGVGCEGANLRLGTSPEVWLLTLHRE